MSQMKDANPNTETGELLSRADLARRWHVCTLTIARRERAGKLPFLKLGERLKRYRLADVLKIEAEASV